MTHHDGATMRTKADFYRALEAAHPGAFEAFERFTQAEPACHDTATSIALTIDPFLSPAFETAFVTFASASKAKRADAPGLGKSSAGAKKLYTHFAAGDAA